MSISFKKAEGPAVDLNKVRLNHPDMAKKIDKVGLSLSKRDMTWLRANFEVYLDYSISMEPDYRSGVVQKIIERVLAWGLYSDVDGVIPVKRFHNNLFPPVKVTLQNYGNIAQRELSQGQMGGTEMVPVFQDLLSQVKGKSIFGGRPKKLDVPIIAIIIGDGQPQDASACEPLIVELANYGVFIKFIAIRPIEWLQVLDDWETERPNTPRARDNVDTKFISNPDSLSDLQFMDKMVDEIEKWYKDVEANL